MKIIRYRGIPIHKVFSDDDFVEKVKKSLKRSKKFIWIHIAVLLFVSVFTSKMIQLLCGIIEKMPDEEQKMVWLGLILGCAFGAFLAQYIVIALQSISMALDLFDSNRGNKLLIKYHDMLKENGLLKEEQEEQDGQILRVGEDDRQPLCR
jgi:hypothetical protein